MARVRNSRRTLTRTKNNSQPYQVCGIFLIMRKHFTVTLDEEVIESLRKIAAEDPDKLPLSRVVERMLREGIKKHEEDKK